MSKKTAGGLLGTLVIAGVAAGVAKYLKDYAGASYTNADEIEKVKKNSGEVKEAAKRTYIAIKEKGDIKGAANDLAKAAGDVVADAGNIAKTAGTGAYNAAKTIKDRYTEDPEAAKDEMINNLKDMGQEIYDAAVDAADSVKNKFTAEADDEDAEAPCGCQSYSEAAESCEDDDDTADLNAASEKTEEDAEETEESANESETEEQPDKADDSSSDADTKVEIETPDDKESSVEISDEN